MNKTPKLKSRTLGFRCRGQKIAALALKEIDCESDEQTNSRHLLKGKHKLIEPDNDVTSCLKESRLNEINEMMTPVKTQKLPSSFDNESPDLNQESPVLQSNFLRTYGSPEVEVSWDYSCSQAPKDSGTPALRIKQRCRQFPKALPPLLNLQPRLLRSIEISEEEQRRQIDCLKGFYEELLKSEDSTSSSPTKSPDEVRYSTEQNRPKCTVSNYCDNLNKMESKQEQDGLTDSLFNDSSNDIMLACTQVVEDELFEHSQVLNGKHLQRFAESDINMNCNVKQSRNTSLKYNSCAKTKLFSDSSGFENINNQTNLKLDNESKITDVRYPHNGHHSSNSQLIVQNQGCVTNNKVEEKHLINEENEGLQRLSKGDTLNSDTKNLNTRGNMDDIYSLFDDSIDEMMAKCSQDVEEKLLSQESKKTDIKQSVASKKHSASPLVKCVKVSKTNYKQPVHVQDFNDIDKLDRPCTNINMCINKQEVVADTRVNGLTDKMNKPVNVQQISGMKVGSSRQPEASAQAQAQGTIKPVDCDISALLNDDDAYLTSIDFSSFDSACANQTYVAPLSTTATQKIYSQHEIEAKRIEALNKLRRKKRKT